MIVRCGRCKTELEIAGPGEFLCPACGSRNAVRGNAPAASPFAAPTGFDGLGSTGASAPPLQGPPVPPPDVRWVTCPNCSYRFVVGEVDEVPCPTCAKRLDIRDEVVKVSQE